MVFQNGESKAGYWFYRVQLGANFEQHTVNIEYSERSLRTYCYQGAIFIAEKVMLNWKSLQTYL